MDEYEYKNTIIIRIQEFNGCQIDGNGRLGFGLEALHVELAIGAVLRGERHLFLSA